MTPADDELWADLEAAPLNMWVGEPQPGLWCPACHLPSGWKAPVGLDPHGDPNPAWMYGCADVEDHACAVRDEDGAA